MNIVAITTTTISPANVPVSVSVIVLPGVAPPGTAGAMSPEPLTTNVLPCWVYPSASACMPSASVMTASPFQSPVRLTCSNVAVATVAPPVAFEPPREFFVTSTYPGEVTNSPIWTVVGAPLSWTVPSGVHRVPSLPSYPVMLLPLRSSLSQRSAVEPALSPVKSYCIRTP